MPQTEIWQYARLYTDPEQALYEWQAPEAHLTEDTLGALAVRLGVAEDRVDEVSTPDDADLLNVLGLHGWDLVYVRHRHGGGITIIFKRRG